MIKFIGLFVFVVGMTTAGVGMSESLNRRLRSLEAFVRFVDALEARIDAFRTPVAEFVDSYDDPNLEAFCRCVRETGSIENAVDACADNLKLAQSDVRLIRLFAHELGQLSAAEEVKRCAYCKRELEKAAAAVRDELPVKSKLYKSGGLMAGVLIAVLFL